MKATSFGVIFTSLQVPMSDEDATYKIFFNILFLVASFTQKQMSCQNVNFDWICVDCCVFVLFDHSSKKYELLSGQL